MSFWDSVHLRIAVANDCSDPRGPSCREPVTLDNGMGLAAPRQHASEAHLLSEKHPGRLARVFHNKARVWISWGHAAKWS